MSFKFSCTSDTVYALAAKDGWTKRVGNFTAHLHWRPKIPGHPRLYDGPPCECNIPTRVSKDIVGANPNATNTASIDAPARNVCGCTRDQHSVVVLDVTDNVAARMSKDVAGTAINDRNIDCEYRPMHRGLLRYCGLWLVLVISRKK